MQKTVVQRLKELQNSLNLTQIEFAEMVNISPSNLSGIYNGKRTCGETVITKIIKAIPGLSRSWLADGVGQMYKSNATTPVPVDYSKIHKVPLYTLDVVAGVHFNSEVVQEWEGEIPWEGSRDGDFAVHVNGDSMEPTIPNHSIVLLRPEPFALADILFGKIHVVCIEDGNAYIKRIATDPSDHSRIRLLSDNPAYPHLVYPLSDITHIYRVISMRVDF